MPHRKHRVSVINTNLCWCCSGKYSPFNVRIIQRINFVHKCRFCKRKSRNTAELQKTDLTIGYKKHAGCIHFVAVTSDPTGGITWTNELQNPPGFTVFLISANKGFWLASIVTNCGCIRICQRLLIAMIFHLWIYPSFSCDADTRISNSFHDGSQSRKLYYQPKFHVFFFNYFKYDIYLNILRR